MGSLTHHCKATGQVKMSDRPISHYSCTLAVLCLCVAIGLIGPPVGAEEPQSRCAQIGQKWVDFWSNHDATKVLDVFTEDIVYEDVPTGHVLHGAEAFQAFAHGFLAAFPNLSFELVQSVCRGQQGFFEWIMNAVDEPGFCGTGKPVTVRGVTFIEVQRNKISRDSDFWDLATMLRQLLPKGQECVARLLGFSEE